MFRSKRGTCGAAFSALAVAACMLAVACQPPQDAQAASAFDPTEDLHQKLLQIATDDYTLGELTKPEANDPMPIAPSPVGQDIQVYSFSMTPNGPITPEGRFVMAILSTRKYKRLGLEVGMNYVLKVTKGTNFEYVIVPDRAKAKMYYLQKVVISPPDYSPAPHLIRRKMGVHASGNRFITDYVIGSCIENCGAGHCGTSATGIEFSSLEAQRWGLK